MCILKLWAQRRGNYLSYWTFVSLHLLILLNMLMEGVHLNLDIALFVVSLCYIDSSNVCPVGVIGHEHIWNLSLQYDLNNMLCMKCSIAPCNTIELEHKKTHIKNTNILTCEHGSLDITWGFYHIQGPPLWFLKYDYPPFSKLCQDSSLLLLLSANVTFCWCDFFLLKKTRMPQMHILT